MTDSQTDGVVGPGGRPRTHVEPGAAEPGQALGHRWRGETIPPVVLGTVQLGLPYGIANTRGQPSPAQAREIVAAALAAGIDFFDTAQAYGTSEEVLGEALSDLGARDRVRVVSKIAPELDPTDADGIFESVSASRRRLNAEALWGMMLHDAGWLTRWDEGVGEALKRARDRGLVKYVGASVYTVDQAKRALANEDIDIVQVPGNAWDQRMRREGVFDLARQNDKLCFVRSIYLQGLLLMRPEDIANRLPAAVTIATNWRALARKHGIEPLELAFRAAKAYGWPMVVGADTPEQIRQTARLATATALSADVLNELNETVVPLADETIVDPSRW